MSAGKLVLLWDTAGIPLAGTGALQREPEYSQDIEMGSGAILIGTARPPENIRPLLWIGAHFGQPTGAAGEPWPVPDGACLPEKAANRLAAVRVRPEQCDSFWFSFFLPDWQEIDQDRDPVLIRLALAWAEAMTLSAVVEEIAQDVPGGVNWLIRWRFATWWASTPTEPNHQRIAARGEAFRTYLSRRAEAATGATLVSEQPSN